MKNHMIRIWLKLFTLLDVIVNPAYSKIYRRFLALIGLLSLLFIYNSSLDIVIKLILISILLFQLKNQYLDGKPHPELNAIKIKGKEWLLINTDGHEQSYDSLIILIHNPLFQLLRFSQLKKNKLIILFNDQLSAHQLRLLHLKSVKN